MFFALFLCRSLLAKGMCLRLHWRFRDERSLIGLIAAPLPAVATTKASAAMNVESVRSPVVIPVADPTRK